MYMFVIRMCVFCFESFRNRSSEYIRNTFVFQCIKIMFIYSDGLFSDALTFFVAFAMYKIVGTVSFVQCTQNVATHNNFNRNRNLRFEL